MTPPEPARPEFVSLVNIPPRILRAMEEHVAETYPRQLIMRGSDGRPHLTARGERLIVDLIEVLFLETHCAAHRLDQTLVCRGRLEMFERVEESGDGNVWIRYCEPHHRDAANARRNRYDALTHLARGIVEGHDVRSRAKTLNYPTTCHECKGKVPQGEPVFYIGGRAAYRKETYCGACMDFVLQEARFIRRALKATPARPPVAFGGTPPGEAV